MSKSREREGLFGDYTEYKGKGSGYEAGNSDSVSTNKLRSISQNYNSIAKTSGGLWLISFIFFGFIF